MTFLKKILLRIIFFYFLFCLLLELAIWTTNIGCSQNFSSNCPDAWVLVEPSPPDWVKNSPSDHWLDEKWKSKPDWAPSE